MRQYLFTIPLIILILASVGLSLWLIGKINEPSIPEKEVEQTNDPNLVGHWNFNEGEGQAAGDSSQSGREGYLGPSQTAEEEDPTWVAAGKEGAALEFDGVNDYVQTTSNILKIANEFTITVWFKADTTEFARHILWQGDSAGNGWGYDQLHQEMHISLGNIFETENQSNVLSFFFGDEAGDEGIITIVVPFRDTTNWNFAAVTVSNLDSSPSAELFLNGVSVGTDTGSLSRTSRVNWDTALRIGSAGLNETKPYSVIYPDDSNKRHFDGLIDEVRIYDRVLSKDEISQIFEADSQKMSNSATDHILSQMNTCYEEGAENRCYEDLALDFLDQAPLREVMTVFADHETRPEIFSRCHAAAHYLGRQAYKEIQQVAETYEQCTSACWGGCYHGVIEQYIAENNLFPGDLDALTAEILTVCGTEDDYDKPRVFGECLHGIGHAMMFITNADLPRSLEFCDVLPSVQQREVCYGGIFMENSSSSTSLDHPSEYLKLSDPMYPCNILEEKYKKLCYQYQSSYFAIITQSDWLETIDLCLQVPIAYQDGCFQVLGSNQVGRTQDLQLMNNTCELVQDTTLKQNCIAGVVEGLTGRYVGDASYVLKFCSTVVQDTKNICYSQIGKSVSSWARNTALRDAVCEEILEEKYQLLCKKGNEV